MSWFVSEETEQVSVPMGECRCPGLPHSEDIFYLRPKLGPDAAWKALQAFVGTPESREPKPPEEWEPEALRKSIGWIYVRYGTVAWNLETEDGPLPCTVENIDKLDWDAIMPVAEKAAELYSEALLRPLVARASRSSKNGRTAKSTSRSRKSSASRRKPSKPSTTATTSPRP